MACSLCISAILDVMPVSLAMQNRLRLWLSAMVPRRISSSMDFQRVCRLERNSSRSAASSSHEPTRIVMAAFPASPDQCADSNSHDALVSFDIPSRSEQCVSRFNR